MAAGPRALEIHVELLDVDVGHWCEHCLLPSGIWVSAVQKAPAPGWIFFGFNMCTDCENNDCPPLPLRRALSS